MHITTMHHNAISVNRRLGEISKNVRVLTDAENIINDGMVNVNDNIDSNTKFDNHDLNHKLHDHQMYKNPNGYSFCTKEIAKNCPPIGRK